MISIANTSLVQPDEWRRAATRCGRFEVSRDGRVRNRFNEKELTLTALNGYLGFATRSGRKGRAYAYKVHRLVALAFLGPRPTERHMVNHKDGDKLNNHAWNLEWVTAAENSRHAVRLGLLRPARGMEQVNAKLTDDVVRYVRRVYEPRHPQRGARALGARFGVHHSTISRVARKQAWAHVKGERP